MKLALLFRLTLLRTLVVDHEVSLVVQVYGDDDRVSLRHIYHAITALTRAHCHVAGTVCHALLQIHKKYVSK